MKIRLATAAGVTAAVAAGLLPFAGTASADQTPNLVGPGCASYAQQVPTGPGSIAAMAQEPVAVAASNNPLLTTLTAAVSGKLNPNVNLVDTLNGGQFDGVRTGRRRVRRAPVRDDRLVEDRFSRSHEHPHLPCGARSGEPAER